MSTKPYELKIVPSFDIDLDISPDKRWIPLVKQYKKKLKNVYDKMEKMLVDNIGFGGNLKLWLVEKAINLYGDSPLYYDEIKSIANELDIPVNRMILIQLCYECFTACTSIIIDNEDKLSYPIHLRTMDWDDNFLRDITINVRFIKNKRYLFEATTWVGYMGILTGVKPNLFSISINYRRNHYPQFWKNIVNVLRFNFPVGYLVRECLTNCTNYDNIVNIMQETKLIAPCYIIMTGVNAGSGKVIVRDRNKYKTNKINLTQKYLFQTNIDPGDANVHHNIEFSLERNYKAEQKCQTYLAHLEENNSVGIINPTQVIHHFLEYPILNHHNIYVNVMSPCGPNPDTYLNGAWIIYPKPT
jgi:hypothetical protein